MGPPGFEPEFLGFHLPAPRSSIFRIMQLGGWTKLPYGPKKCRINTSKPKFKLLCERKITMNAYKYSSPASTVLIITFLMCFFAI